MSGRALTGTSTRFVDHREIEGRYGATGGSIQSKQAEGLEAFQRLLKRGMAHAVVDNVRATPTRQRLHVVSKASNGCLDLGRLEREHVIGSLLLDHGKLRFGAACRDDGRTKELGEVDGGQARGT